MDSTERCRQHGLLVVGAPLAGVLAVPAPAALSVAAREDGVAGTGGCAIAMALRSYHSLCSQVTLS